MKIPHLETLMVSISDFKKNLSEVINQRMTKVIIKNNEPVSVIMPYSQYVTLMEDVDDQKKKLVGLGQAIQLSNGVELMVSVETGVETTNREEVSITTYVKMKTSGNYKKFYTLHLSPPTIEQTLTTEEIVELYKKGISLS